MLLVNANPDAATLSIPTDDEDAPIVIDRRDDGTFDVPFDLAADLLEWPHWSVAPAPSDPELAEGEEPAPRVDYLPSLKDLRKHELQALCLERGLANDGTNADLVERLRLWAAAAQAS